MCFNLDKLILSKSCKTQSVRLGPDLLPLLHVQPWSLTNWVYKGLCENDTWACLLLSLEFSVACHYGCIDRLWQLTVTMYCASIFTKTSLWFDLAEELKITFSTVFLCIVYNKYIYVFIKGSGLVQSQHEPCLLHWAENATNRAAGMYLPRLHLSESALLYKSHSWWRDLFLAIMFAAWINMEFLSVCVKIFIV